MDSGLVTSLSGALAQSKKIEVIANNLANTDTAGFKADELSFEETLESAHRKDLRTDIPSRSFTDSELLSEAGREVRPVLYGAEFMKLRPGAIKHTGNPFDIAIEGNGFIEILTPQGVRLSRAGNLTIDGEGRLSTPEGSLVLGPGGAGVDPASRAIVVGKGTLNFDSEGNIYVKSNGAAAALVGRLSLVQVENPKGLKKAGYNSFEATPDAFVVENRAPASGETQPPKKNPLGPTSIPPKIHQGMLESSNVNPIEEMTEMIKAQRLFEQNTKLMQGFGELQTRSSELGKF